MNMFKSFCVASVAAVMPAYADWQLDNTASSVSLVSVKKNSIAEVHQFHTLAGTISKDGSATLTVDLTSIDSGIEIRDQRMRDYLFEVKKFPAANAKVAFDTKALKALPLASPASWTVDAVLNLHGVELQQKWDLQIVKLSDDKLLVSTVKPVVVDAASFAMQGGVSKLQELASLPSIATAVPVSVNLLFRMEK